jgi:hypothetical protein
MAAAMAQQQHGNRISTGFAALQPASDLYAPMVQAMQRVGTDMGYRQPQGIDQVFYGSTPDLTITIGETVDQKRVPGKKKVSWHLPEPTPSDNAAMDRLRLEIEAHVDTLMRFI